MMANNSEFALFIRQINKVHDHIVRLASADYPLSKTEVDVMIYLYNNPEYNTASDITEFRRIPKANVSQAVESLVQKGYLTKASDSTDRRRDLLFPTEQSKDILTVLNKIDKLYSDLLFTNFTEKEREEFSRMSRKVLQNANAALQNL